MKRIERSEEKKTKTSLYWIVGIVGIFMVGAWSYFDPGDRVLFDDKAKKMQHLIESQTIPNDTITIEIMKTPTAHSTHFH